MKADPPLTDHSTSICERFFESNYSSLRNQIPMRWMVRLFLQLADGQPPGLVDLPTGAGKTDVVVIWVLALSWYGLNSPARSPVPRRLVWVINRRVLVQQVFRLAVRLSGKLSFSGEEADALSDVRTGLARLSGDPNDILRVVQLRGQLIDDSEWSVAPSVPQLVIGTVDQIGSRLLFQGYGLGKWSRPMQAGLLGVDAWICVDEAHLVPAFVLALRQIRRLTEAEILRLPDLLSSVFARLPFWMTELSATPGLQPPNAGSAIRLRPEDEKDTQLKDRLLAARTRRAMVRWLGTDEKLEEAIESAAAELADEVGSVAVFVRTPKAANKIATALSKKFTGRVLRITGRLRGYERDRLEQHPVFKRFAPPADVEGTKAISETVFLVGTSAAEVGLDADAAAIICDFASLPTLLQRLGRLDRRGLISAQFHGGKCDAPTMTIFARTEKAGPNLKKREESESDIQTRVSKLAQALARENDDLAAQLLVGMHWKEAMAKDGVSPSDQDGYQASEEEDNVAQAVQASEIVNAATWTVLLGARKDEQHGEVAACPPSAWLGHPVSGVAAGPVAVPPLTTALVEHWSATTSPRNTFLPVHPFLYGILPDEEGTPLVSLAFRLELDALTAAKTDQDETDDEGGAVQEQVLDIFRRFPPRRAEFHFVSLTEAREWYSSEEAAEIPVVLFDGESWSMPSERKDGRLLRPGTTVVLPTSAGSGSDLCKLLEGASGEKSDEASRDVLEGVSAERPLYWRRVVQVESGDYRLTSTCGAARVEQTEVGEATDNRNCGQVGVNVPDAPSRDAPWKVVPPSYKLRIGTTAFRFEYLKPQRQIAPQFLKDHLDRAEADAGRIAGALAADNEFLRRLFSEAAKVHDEGKREPKWQRAMGNRDMAHPVAKPLVERPSSTGGFRHEWKSLMDIRRCSPGLPEPSSEPETQLGSDLWHHLVASHHGHLRPWLADRVLEAHALGRQQQSALRLESAERFARLQRRLGPWRLAYLEALIKAADVSASKSTPLEDDDEQ